MLIRNTGATPASSLDVCWRTSHDGLETWNAVYRDAQRGALIMGPKEDLVDRFDQMPLKTYIEYQKDEGKPMYLGVTVTYADPFGGYWIAGIEFQMTGRIVRQIQGAAPQPFSEEIKTVAPPWRTVGASTPRSR